MLLGRLPGGRQTSKGTHGLAQGKSDVTGYQFWIADFKGRGGGRSHGVSHVESEKLGISSCRWWMLPKGVKWRSCVGKVVEFEGSEDGFRGMKPETGKHACPFQQARPDLGQS